MEEGGGKKDGRREKRDGEGKKEVGKKGEGEGSEGREVGYEEGGEGREVGGRMEGGVGRGDENRMHTVGDDRQKALAYCS